MHCDKCNKKKSTVIYHENLSGRARTLHLCADCAREMEQAGELEEMSAAFAAFSSPMLGVMDRPHRSFRTAIPPVTDEHACSACGITAREIATSGRVGCATCYECLGDVWRDAYGDKQDRGMYRGQVARLVRVREENARRMQLLRTQLADAISGEQYEQAAILRDRIRELETGMEATAPLDLNTRNVHNVSITSKEGN